MTHTVSLPLLMFAFKADDDEKSSGEDFLET